MENKKRRKSSVSAGEHLYESWSAVLSRFTNGMTVKDRIFTLAGAVLTFALTLMAADTNLPFFRNMPSAGISYPMADALFFASGRFAPFAFIALIVHAFRTQGQPFVRIALITGTASLRVLYYLKMKEKRGSLSDKTFETPSMKLVCATVFSIASCSIYAVNLGLNTETLPLTLAVLLVPPTLSFLLSGALIPQDEYSHGQALRELSAYLLFAFTVYSAGGHLILGCPLPTLLAIFFTASTAIKGGLIRGGVLGLALGAIISPSYSPILAATGVFAGALGALGAGAAVGISCAAGCVIALYAYGYASAIKMIPEAVISTAFTAPIIKYDLLPRLAPFIKKQKDNTDAVIEKELDALRDRRNAQRLYIISDAFTELSATHKKSVEQRPSSASRRPVSDGICDKLRHGFCDSCPLVCICWDSNLQKTKDAVKTLISSLTSSYKESIADGNRLSWDFKCLRRNDVIKEVKRLCDGESEASLDNTANPAYIGFSEEYRCVSEMLKDIANSAEDETEADEEAAEQVKRAARALSFKAKDIGVYGKRIKTVVAYGIENKADKIDIEVLRAEFSKACGALLSPPMITEDRMVFEETARFNADSSCACLGRSGEGYNGDASVSFSTESNYHYCMICDGMGSGKEAAETSGIAVSLTEKMLKCEIEPKLAVRLVDNALRRRNAESFTTLDLLKADLMNGRASVMKNGAASSYLLRDGEVTCLSAPSLPLGITAEASPERIGFSLRHGDTIVMVSDGIAQDEDDGDWLMDLISDIKAETTSDAAAKEILNTAVKKQGGADSPERDDMTVIVSRFSLSDPAA